MVSHGGRNLFLKHLAFWLTVGGAIADLASACGTRPADNLFRAYFSFI